MGYDIYSETPKPGDEVLVLICYPVLKAAITVGTTLEKFNQSLNNQTVRESIVGIWRPTKTQKIANSIIEKF